ncbi:MAG: methyltransferase domain-containing protein [Thermomicrobiales bacterium]|nr:methyltransferase domain-containing protein [Thermomicrobiales bacterium]
MSARRMNYNELASSYGAHRRPNPAVLELLHGIAQEAERPRLLEIGVGTGNFASALAGLGIADVTGIDPSIGMIEQVPEPAVKRALARAEALPFSDNQFTLLYSVDVIHHIIDRDAAAREAFRVLQPGGQIAIVTDSEIDVQNRIPLATYFPETVPKEIARYPRIEALESELKAAGFVEIKRRQTLTHREVTDIAPYRDKAFSSLHLISDEAHAKGIAAMERDLAKGLLQAQQPYTIVIGRR